MMHFKKIKFCVSLLSIATSVAIVQLAEASERSSIPILPSIQAAQAQRAEPPGQKTKAVATPDLFSNLALFRGHASNAYLGQEPEGTQVTYKFKFMNALLSLAVKEALTRRGDMLPDPETTATLAARFLSDEQIWKLFSSHQKKVSFNKVLSKDRARVIADISYELRNLNEMDMTSVIEKFRDEYMPIIAASAPALPFNFVSLNPSDLDAYNFEKGGYDFGTRLNQAFAQHTYLTHDSYESSLVDIKPQFVKVDIEAAKTIAQNVKSRPVAAVFGRIEGVDLGDIFKASIGGKKVYRLTKDRSLPFNISLKNAALFSDESLISEIAALDFPGSKPLPASSMTSPPRVLIQVREAPAARPKAIIEVENSAAFMLTRSGLTASDPNDALLRIGGSVVIPKGLKASAIHGDVNWQRGLRGRKLDQVTSAAVERHEVALAKYVSSLAYTDWLKQNPAMQTPIEMVGHFATLFLTQDEVNGLYDNAFNRGFKLAEAPLIKYEGRPSFIIGDMLDLEPLSQKKVVERFDQRYRERVAVMARSRDIVMIGQFDLGRYDFENRGLVINDPPLPSNQKPFIVDRFSDFAVLPGAWGGLTASYTLPLYPNYIKMSQAEASALQKQMYNNGTPIDSYVFNAQFGNISEASITIKDRKILINITVAIRKIALFREGSLQSKLIEVDGAAVAPLPVEGPVQNRPPLEARAVNQGASHQSYTLPILPPRIPPPVMPAIAPPKPQQAHVPALQKAEAPLAQSAPVVVERQRAFKPDRTFDILGLNLGMTATEAERVLRSSDEFKRALRVKPDDGDMLKVFANAKVFIRNDSKEYIALVTQPDRTGDKLVAIGRYAFAGLGVYKFDDFIASMSGKYGQVRERNGNFFHWGGLVGPGRSDGPCFTHLGVVNGIEWTREDDGKPPEWAEYRPVDAPSAFGGPRSMAWAGLKVRDFGRAREFQECGPSITAWIPTVADQVGEFAIWLADTGVYFDIMANRMKGGGTARPKL